MRTVLLGPQRFSTTVGNVVNSVAPDGPVATVRAGWRDREADISELDGVLEGRGWHLNLYARLIDVLETDSRYAEASLAHRDALVELANLYSLRLQRALDSAYLVQRRALRPWLAASALEDAIRKVQGIDRWYLDTLGQIHGELAAAAPAEESEPISRHRSEVAQLVDQAAVLAIAGGHVGVLLRCLRLFAVTLPPELPVIGWSAGAMALTERVVLYNDLGPRGVVGSEVWDRGLGRAPRIVAMPHARRRLNMDDPTVLQVLVRRFADARCLLLDDGARVELDADGELPAGARVIGGDGALHTPGRAIVTAPTALVPKRRSKLAINRLMDRRPLDGSAIDRFLERHQAPIVEGDRATFLWRGDANEVLVRHRVVGWMDPLPLRRIKDTDLWYATVELPHGSRVEYQFELVWGEHREQHVNDPLNQRVAHGPFGASSVLAATGYEVPDWCQHDPEARPGELIEQMVRSKALRREMPFMLYLPARFRTVVRYPLLIVHDGIDYLNYTAFKTVLDNLIDRNEVAEMVVAFVPPGDRLVEYANYAPHARFLARELTPYLLDTYPLVPTPEGRTLMGSSFGGVAAMSTAARYPGQFGSLLMESASLVFTDIGADHGGGRAFDPVVKFVNSYRARPRRIVERIFMSCGMYEPLITPNRSMVTTFRETGMEVRYVEPRDGHNWENWRDRLRDGLTWLHPGDQKFVYE